MVLSRRLRVTDLSERVTLESLAASAVAGTGGLSQSFAEIKRAWAAMAPAAPGRFVAGVQVDDIGTHQFTVRWFEDWRDVKFIARAGRRWRVLGASEVEPRRWVAFAAVEEGPTT